MKKIKKLGYTVIICVYAVLGLINSVDILKGISDGIHCVSEEIQCEPIEVQYEAVEIQCEPMAEEYVEEVPSYDYADEESSYDYADEESSYDYVDAITELEEDYEVNAIIEFDIVKKFKDDTNYSIELHDVNINKTVEPQLPVFSSITMQTDDGDFVTTNKVTIDVTKLVNIYNNSYESPAWDDKHKIAMLNTLWEFLVVQQGMAPENAAGLLGNVYEEGRFSEEQGTGYLITNIWKARELLGTGERGYGCAQWTYDERQLRLLDYYEMAYTMFPNNWTYVQIAAECCMLLEECKAYGVFEDIYTATSIEDATGKVCTRYERYGGCDEQWSYWDGRCHLVSDQGNGIVRYQRAKDIYFYFTR